MHIKTTMRYHLTAVRMAIIKVSQKTTNGEDVKKTEHLLLMKMLINPTSMEDRIVISQKTKNRTTILPSNPTTGYLPRGKEVIM